MSAHSGLVFLHSRANPCHRARIDKHFEGYSTLQFMTSGAVELFYDEVRHEMRCDDGACWFWTAFPGPRIRFHATLGHHEWNHRYVGFTGPLVEHWKNAGLWLQGPQRAPRGAQHAA